MFLGVRKHQTDFRLNCSPQWRDVYIANGTIHEILAEYCVSFLVQISYPFSLSFQLLAFLFSKRQPYNGSCSCHGRGSFSFMFCRPIHSQVKLYMYIYQSSRCSSFICQNRLTLRLKDLLSTQAVTKQQQQQKQQLKVLKVYI